MFESERRLWIVRISNYVTFQKSRTLICESSYPKVHVAWFSGFISNVMLCNLWILDSSQCWENPPTESPRASSERKSDCCRSQQGTFAFKICVNVLDYLWERRKRLNSIFLYFSLLNIFSFLVAALTSFDSFTMNFHILFYF